MEKVNISLQEPIGSMLTAKVREKKAETVMRNYSCKSRIDIAGESIDIEWHVCLGDTSVQILQKLPGFMSETGHALESQTRLFFLLSRIGQELKIP